MSDTLKVLKRESSILSRQVGDLRKKVTATKTALAAKEKLLSEAKALLTSLEQNYRTLKDPEVKVILFDEIKRCRIELHNARTVYDRLADEYYTMRLTAFGYLKAIRAKSTIQRKLKAQIAKHNNVVDLNEWRRNKSQNSQ